jgi:hypothetical protein
MAHCHLPIFMYARMRYARRIPILERDESFRMR